MGRKTTTNEDVFTDVPPVVEDVPEGERTTYVPAEPVAEVGPEVAPGVFAEAGSPEAAVFGDAPFADTLPPEPSDPMMDALGGRDAIVSNGIVAVQMPRGLVHVEESVLRAKVAEGGPRAVVELLEELHNKIPANFP